MHAYEKGATGKGITAAIIDSGFAPDSPQFAGRIHAASTDVAASRGLYGESGHGALVSSVLGAAKDDSGMHGVAFNATLLMLRTDRPDTCATKCEFDGIVLAKAFDLAIQNAVRVINMSLGGPDSSPLVAQAIDRATAAGIVVVLPAGNNGAAEPVASSMIATKPEARGTVIIAGALNSAGTDMASFSDRAGSGAEFYLVAAGEGMLAYNRDGALVTVKGTSFATPTIAGAVALLAQAFPNLTGQQIVKLLLTTATDMGAPGTDNIFGRGMLNLANAFSPQGTLSLAGSMAPLSLTSNGVLSPAMGDSKGDLKGAVFLDGYARAYETDPGRTLSRTAQDAPLHAALDASYSTNSAQLGPVAASIATRRNLSSPPEAELQRMGLSEDQARAAKAIAATVLARLSPRTAVALGLSESGRALQQRLSQQQGNAFLVARDPLAGNGFQVRGGSSIGIRHDLGPLAFTVTSEAGEVYGTYPAQRSGNSAYRTTALIADRKLGRMRFSLGGSLLDEETSILGGRFSSAFSSAGSTSWFTDGSASLDLGGGWGAYASYRHGWTSVRSGDALVRGGRLSSNAFAFDLTKAGALTTSDKVGVRIMQPLRVRSGGFDIHLPVSYDYASGQVGYQQRFFNLAPTGRELDYELSYATPLLGGNMAANAFLRTDPGHIQSMKKDIGAALRFTLGF
ncbi:MAG TPA: S8 family peptidase [Allosphingosinicella sp.]|nr:S8 family peptidase [Allosphingosinicella sp.]